MKISKFFKIMSGFRNSSSPEIIEAINEIGLRDCKTTMPDETHATVRGLEEIITARAGFQYAIDNPAIYPRRRDELKRAAQRIDTAISLLETKTTTVYFVGRVGVGKTTLISVLGNLIRDQDEYVRFSEKAWDKKYKSLLKQLVSLKEKQIGVTANGQPEKIHALTDRVSRTEKELNAHIENRPLLTGYRKTSAHAALLPVGRGRTTLCMTSIEHGSARVIIEPLAYPELTEILRLCVATLSGSGADDAEDVSFPDEMRRAIANMAGMKQKHLAEALSAMSAGGSTEDEMVTWLWERTGITDRTEREFVWSEADGPVAEWMADILADIHLMRASNRFGRRIMFPKTVMVSWPRCPVDLKLVDLRGMDGNAITPSAEICEAMTQTGAILAFCSPAESAPGAECEMAASYRMRIYDLKHDMMLFGLSRDGDADTNLDTGDLMDEDDSPLCFGGTEAARMRALIASEKFRRLGAEQAVVCFGETETDAGLFLDAIQRVRMLIQTRTLTELRHDVASVEKLLDQSRWLDDFYFSRLRDRVNQIATRPSIAMPAVPRGFDAGIPAKTWPSVLYAMVRRFGVFDSLDMTRTLADQFVQIAGNAIKSVEDMLPGMFSATRETCAGHVPEDIMDDCERVIRTEISEWGRFTRQEIQHCLKSFLEERMRCHPLDKDFEYCAAIWGHKEKYAALGQYRHVVISRLDKMTGKYVAEALVGRFLELWKSSIAQLRKIGESDEAEPEVQSQENRLDDKLTLQAETDELELSWDSYRWDGISGVLSYNLTPDTPVTHEPVHAFAGLVEACGDASPNDAPEIEPEIDFEPAPDPEDEENVDEWHSDPYAGPLPVRDSHPVQVRQRIYGLESLDDLACAQTEF